MGKIDAYAKTFMAHPEVFAEFYNFLFRRNGDELSVGTDSLEERDSGVTVALAGQLKKTMERRNDLVRQAFLHDGRNGYSVVMCLEIQSFVRYEQPLQNAICIAIRTMLAAQMLAHRHEQERGGAGSPLQLLEEDDVLPTVIQAVLYLGDRPWTAKDSLRRLTDMPQEQMGKYLLDCPSCVVSLVDLTDEEISSLRTELKALAVFVKYGRDRDRLQSHLDSDPMFRHLSGDAVRLISECTHIRFTNKIRQEGNNMCQAIDEMIEIAYQKGKRERDERTQRRLLKQKNTIRKKDSQLQKKDCQLQKKDCQLQKKDCQLQKKDCQILQQKSQLQQKDSQLQKYKLILMRTIEDLALKGQTAEDIEHIVNSSVADMQAVIESIDAMPVNSRPSQS